MNRAVKVSFALIILCAVCTGLLWYLTARTTGNADDQTACGLKPGLVGTFQTVPTGSFVKGASPIYPEESPSLRVQVASFAVQIHEVTNDQFAAFVADTGYVTDAERSAQEGRAGAGSAVFTSSENNAGTQFPWKLIAGATWKSPEGDGSDISGRGLFPVVHVSQADARAYAVWAGGRLPNEVEWEYVADLGLMDPGVSTSGAYDATGAPVANTWQGVFPVFNTNTDGFSGIAPVGCFPADRTGLHDMIGNVWEWTSTPFGAGTHTIKGGSYLCALNYCQRYRPAARQPQESHFSASHIGFRIVKDVTH